MDDFPAQHDDNYSSFSEDSDDKRNRPKHARVTGTRANYSNRRADGGEGNSELDLRDLLRTLWRRKALIISVTCLLTVLAGLTVFQLTPRYSAAANVMLETRRNQVTDIESVLSGVNPELATVLSESELIRSNSLLGRVVDKLKLVRDPEFNGSLREAPWYSSLLSVDTYLSKDIQKVLGLHQREPVMLPEEKATRTRAQVIESLLGKLSVSPVGRSLVIRISVESEDPRKAALIANTIADEYIVDQLEAKFEATRKATGWLNERLTKLKEKVRETESAVQAYRESVSDQLGRGSKQTDQQINELNSELIRAQAKRAEAEARLAQVQRLIQSGDSLNTAAEVLSSPLIARLREQESEVLRRVSELETRYGERHPEMVKARSELRDLRRSIAGEVRKIAQSLKNEVDVARARERTLERNVQKLENESQAQSKAEIRLRELQREAEANRTLYETFLQRFKETSEQENLQQADSRVISYADVPTSPVFPKKKLTLALSGIGALFLGTILAFVVERLDNTFRSSEQVETILGHSVIGMVPFVEKKSYSGNLSRYVAENPGSQVGESIRNIRTSIMLSNVDDPAKVIGMTSTVPSEGKTTLAAWMGQVGAQSGQKTIILDCDLRRPQLHQVFGLPNEDGVVDLLSGKCLLEHVIQHDDYTGAYFVRAGHSNINALDLLSSKRMGEYVTALKNNFDFVILDMPPILAVSDARILGRLCDSLVYAIQWDKVPRDLVANGIRVAEEAELPISGIAMTQVHVKKHARYGYGDYGYYYSKYRSYYNS